MKQRVLIGILAVCTMCSAMADPMYTFNFTNAFPNTGVVPDGSVTGWSDTRSASGVLGTITDVNVWIELSGGYNGDLYGYLVHDTGFAVLLNRVGVTTSSASGYSDAGMNVMFDDSASDDIHFYQLVSGYGTSLYDGSSWLPDGRNVDPAQVDGTESRTSLLDDFNGLAGDGTWTLFLADLSVGGQTTVAGWGLEITAIPEPSSFVIFGLGLLGVAGLRRYRVRAK